MEYYIKQKFNINGNKAITSIDNNITYGVDKNFLLGAAVSINSILINNTDKNFNFYLFTDYIDHQYIQCFQALMLKYSSNISIFLLETKGLRQMPTSDFWSYATYFRLIAFEYLSNNMNSVLYLDADVICKGNLKKLFQLNLVNFCAAVILDVDNMQQSSVSRLNLFKLNGKYFNAGVIYVNLNKWSKDCFFEQSLNLMKGNTNFGKLKYLDQDVLNILFQTNNIYLSNDYNCIYSLKNELTFFNSFKYKSFIKNSTILIHYTGITKPWHTWGINYPASKFFLNSYSLSPWKVYPLIMAKKRVEFQERYKHLFFQRKYIKSFLYLVEYKLRK